MTVPHFTFKISTESPFAHSTIATPPLGFSLQKKNKNYSSLAITMFIQSNTLNHPYRKSSLSQQPFRNSYQPRLLQPNIFDYVNQNETVNENNYFR